MTGTDFINCYYLLTISVFYYIAAHVKHHSLAVIKINVMDGYLVWITLQFNICVCVCRSGGACTEHRDGLSGLVLPSKRPQRQQHPALSVYIQTIQPQWSVSLSFILQPYCHPSDGTSLVFLTL